MSIRNKATFLLLACFLIASQVANGTPTLFALIGTFRQDTTYTYTVTATPDGRSSLSVTIPLPPGWEQPGHRETIISLAVNANPEPTTTWDKTDHWENRWRTLHWGTPEWESTSDTAGCGGDVNRVRSPAHIITLSGNPTGAPLEREYVAPAEPIGAVNQSRDRETRDFSYYRMSYRTGSRHKNRQLGAG